MIMCRRSRPNSCCEEKENLSGNSSISEDQSDSEIWKNDTNNNVLLHNGRKNDKTDSKKRGTNDSSSNTTKPTPSYVPSYIKSVGFDCNRSKQLSRFDTSKRISLSNRGSGSTSQRKQRAYSTIASSSDTRREHFRLKHKYASLSSPSELIHVRKAVAAMEARINTGTSGLTIKIERSKPVKVTTRPTKDSPKMQVRKKEHRRSMSDPNDKQVNFKQVKELWSQKEATGKQLLADSSARSGGSNSSLNSVGSTVSVEKKAFVKNENVSKKEDKPTQFVKLKATTDNSTRGTGPPLISPRPQNHRLRPRSVTVGQLPLENSEPGEGPSNANQERCVSPPSTERLSVSEKAMLFGGAKIKSIPKEESRHEDVSSRTYRRSMSEEDLKQCENKINGMNREGKMMGIFEKTRRAKREEEERLVGDLRKNAKHAKDRRRIRTSTGSSTVSTPSDDEDKGGFFHGVRRRSKDSGQPAIIEQPTAAIQKTENTIFGSSQVETDNCRLIATEEEFKGRSRASSLKKLLENKFYDSAIQQVSEEVLPDVDNEASKPVARPKNLALGGQQRSETDTLEDKFSSNDTSDSCKSLDKQDPISLKPRLSPTTPDKRSSGFSEEEDSFSNSESNANKPFSSESPSKTEDDTTMEKNELEDSLSLSSTVSSSLIQTPSLTGFNPMEEYDKIAKQLSEEEEETSPKRNIARPISENSSTISVDSGFRNSLEVPQGRDTSMDAWSDFVDNSSDEEGSIPESSSRRQSEILPSPTVSLKEKLHNIAKELLSTEESYVAVLHLIDQVFHKQLLEAAQQKHIMPKQVVDKIFSHVPAIYSFHSSFLLPQLKERLQNWETDPRIGDIMTKAAPFLKMYSLYVQQFDETMNLIKQWSQKSNGFNAIIQAIQKTPECNFLTLQHHMLGPVQRVPRYRMLLADYVKRLPEDAVDRQDAETALNLITKAATHSNETMKKIEKFHKLVSIFNNLIDVNLDFVDVARELLKEGKIIKISARNGEKSERYLYLFSDMLLCCTPQRRLGNKVYRVTAKIDLEGMKVSAVKNPTVPFAFCVNGLQKSMEFASNVHDDSESWIQAIQDAIDEKKDRQQTFKSFIAEQSPGDDVSSGNSPQPSPMHSSKPRPTIDMLEEDIGTRAPRWIKDHETPACMCCSKTFNMLRRRHHCRACGGVVCSECCDNKAMLQYDTSKPLKVCSRCFVVLNKREDVVSDKKSVLAVQAGAVSENSVIANYLFFSDNLKKKGYIRMWCVIPQDEICLYFYGDHQDVRAQMTMPLPGFEVTDIDSPDHRFAFRLKQARTVLHFGCDEEMIAERWKYAINQGSKGYDLNREDVLRLGRPVSSSCSSDDNQEDDDEPEDEEESETEEISEEKESGLEHRLDKFIDDDSKDEGSINEEEHFGIPSVDDKVSETNSESGENSFSNDVSS